MAEQSKIQWTTHTFNPWSGCAKVHTGCANCYAEVNYSVKMRGVKWGPNGTRVVKAESGWKEPLKWNRDAEQAGERRRVFCASLADVFEDWRGQMQMADGLWATINRHMGKFTGYHGVNLRGGNDALTMQHVRQRLFALIDATPWLDWMLLTKRPENVRRMWSLPAHDPYFEIRDKPWASASDYRSNVWLGTSVSDQATADKWIPELLKLRDLTPVLFVSAEPLIGPVNLSKFVPTPDTEDDDLTPHAVYCNRCGCEWQEGVTHRCPPGFGPIVDLVIVGGESGHGARPCNVEWIRSIVKQCGEAGVACFVKQLGALAYKGPDIVGYSDRYVWDAEQLAVCNGSPPQDKKGGDMDEWPADLRVRQMPPEASS